MAAPSAAIDRQDIKGKVRRMARITRLEFAEGGVNLPPMLDLQRSSPEGEHS